MTDIVVRLRRRWDEDCKLAADEIVRLRDENKRLWELVGLATPSVHENLQLHNALNEIEDMVDGEIDINKHGGPNLAMRVQTVLRSARRES